MLGMFVNLSTTSDCPPTNALSIVPVKEIDAPPSVRIAPIPAMSLADGAGIR